MRMQVRYEVTEAMATYERYVKEQRSKTQCFRPGFGKRLQIMDHTQETKALLRRRLSLLHRNPES